MAASIIINQAGKPAGLPSVSRDDLAIGVTVVLTNYDNTGVTTWTWEMLSRPVGSSATISGSALPTASFVPDVTGSYLIKLTLDEDPATDTRIGAVKTSFLGIRKPATSERKEFDSLDGWSAAQQAMIDSVDTDASLNLKRNGTNQPTSDINWGTRKITNLGGLDNEGALRLGEITNPTLVSDKGFVYAKDDGGDTELFWMDDSGAVVQITKDGNLDVSVLQGDALPAKTGDGFLKRNTGNTGWEETSYGVSANTVCEGNDSRLSDDRYPTAHQSSHVSGSDQIPTTSISARGLCPQLDGYSTHYLNGDGYFSTPAGAGGFVTILDVNFSAQPSQTLNVDGDYTIAGVTWTKINSANDRVAMALTSGSGLIIQPAQTTAYLGVTRTLPAILTNISVLDPSFSLGSHLRAWFYISDGNWTAAYDGTVLGVENVAILNCWYDIGKAYSGGVKPFIGSTFNNIDRTGVFGSTGVGARDVYMIEISSLPAYHANVYAGTWGGTWPDLKDMVCLGFVNSGTSNNLATEAVGSPANWSFLLGAQRNGSGTITFSTTIANARLDVWDL